MHTTPLTRNAAVVLLTLAVASVALACSTPPKPRSLVEFEAMRTDKYTKHVRELKENEKLMTASDDFYTLALEAYDDEEMERVDEYSLLGSMRYRNAWAIARQKDAEQRLSDANRKVIDYQGQLAEYEKTAAEVQQTIGALRKAKGLQASLNDKELEAQTDKAAMEAKAADQKARTDAEKLITEAKVRLARADGLEAGKFAPRNYGMGANLLKGAEKFFDDSKFEVAAKQGKDAIELLDKAIEEAEPKFAEQQKIVDRDKLNKELFDEADKSFRELVKIDGRGVVITVDSAFKPNKTKIEGSKFGQLDIVTDLASKYTNYLVLIEGHTDDRGNAAKNITISQARAEAVKDYFLRRGIKAERIQVAGKGGDDPRFPNKGKERARNNRVDVVFLYK